ncbi:MAG: hypothetical protein GXP55_14950 [Deltaproteobacteria bacterium]|nr:hypothetical protein [Deltaproteobacteria bacterium]
MTWMKRSSTSLLLAASILLSSAPLSVSAQPTLLVQVRHDSEPLYDGRSRLRAARFPNGEVLTTQVAIAPGRHRVSLVRYGADGREISRIEAAPESARGSAPFVVGEQLGQVVALPDGSALVAGMSGTVLETDEIVLPFVFRIDRSGRALWRLTGRSTADPRRFFAGFGITLGDQGELFIAGMFTEGSFGLPGAPMWRPRRQNNPFIARVDLDTGRVIWAKRTPRDGYLVVQGGVLQLISSDVPRTRHGDRAPAFSTLRVWRYDVSGRRLGRSRDRIPGASAPRAGAAPLPGGGFAVVTETCRRQDAAGRCLTEGIVYVYDARGNRVATHAVPAWSVLAHPTPGAPLRVIGPTALRRVSVGGSSRIVTDEVEVLTFTDPTQPPTRARIAVPNTRFTSVVDAVRFGGQSLPGGVLFHSPSALLEPGTQDRGVPGDTVIFVPDANFRPVPSLPNVPSDPYPPAPPPAPRDDNPRVLNPFG